MPRRVPSMEENDKDLVAQCLNGNKQAFEQLAEKYARRMYAVAYRFMCNQEDARDVVQESFLSAYNGLDRYDPKHKFVTWLLAITTKQSLYRLRQRKRLRRHNMPLKEDRVGTTVTPDRELEQRAQRQQIEDTLESLPEKYKAILILRHFENMSYEDIAEAMGLPLGTVKTNIYRARRAFTEQLKLKDGVNDEL